jgi:hypothetical protein
VGGQCLADGTVKILGDDFAVEVDDLDLYLVSQVIVGALRGGLGLLTLEGVCRD